MNYVRRQNFSDNWGDLLREGLVAPELTKMNYTLASMLTG
jgi:hypothetical protein